MTVTMTQYFLFHYIYMSVQVNLEQVTKLANGIMNWYILTYKVSNVGSTIHWTKSVCPLMATTKILEKVYIQIFYTVLKITCVIVCNSQPQWVCTEQHYICPKKWSLWSHFLGNIVQVETMRGRGGITFTSTTLDGSLWGRKFYNLASRDPAVNNYAT